MQFGILGLEFGRFGVWLFGFFLRICSLVFEVSTVGFRDFDFEVLGMGFGIQYFGFGIWSFGSSSLGFSFGICTLVFGFGILEFGILSLGFLCGTWSSEIGTLNFGV